VSFAQLIYGNSPYGKVPVESDIKALTRLDLLRAHRKFVRPNGAVLTLTGALTRKKAKELVDRYFQNWKSVKPEFPPAPEVTFVPEPGIYFVEAPFTQSTLRIGHQGVKRLTEDYPAIIAFNEIYGSGGFGSRLMKRVREELGLAYGVYGAILPGVVKGQNVIALQTKTESTADALVESLNILQEMQSELVSEEELEEVQQSLENSFIFRFDTPAKAVDRQAWLQLLEYPDDYDKNYLPAIQALTREEVRTTASNRWDLSKMVIVVVGNGKAYNSLEQMMKEPPEFLKGHSIKKLRFGQKLLE
jgi:zinc protease